MRYLKVLALLIVAIASTGCLRMTYTLSLKPDGSGTIASTLAMTDAMKKQTAMMAGPSGSLLPTEARMRENAASMGSGVRFVSSTPYKSAGFEGVTALYAFDDVNKLNLNMERAISGTINAPQLNDGKIDPKADVKLSLKRDGNRSVLTVGMPELPKPGDDIKAHAGAAAKQSQNPQAEAMMKQMMQGMLIEVALNINGQIVSTNAPFVEKSRVVLLRLDGNELLKSGQSLATLIQMGASGDFESRVRKIPGLKVVTVPELRVEFR